MPDLGLERTSISSALMPTSQVNLASLTICCKTRTRGRQTGFLGHIIEGDIDYLLNPENACLLKRCAFGVPFTLL